MLNVKNRLLIRLSTALIVLSSFSEAGMLNNDTTSVSLQNKHFSTSNYVTTDTIDLICEKLYSSKFLTLHPNRHIQAIRRICDSMTSQVKKTGQTTSYYPKDDGDYQKGLIAHDYERDDENEIVIDHLTKLQWQDNEAVKTDLVEGYYSAQSFLDSYDRLVKFFEQTGDDPHSLDSKHHCMYLNLGGHHDWRLPKFKELLDIVDFGRFNPSLNPIFENTAPNSYWTSSPYGYNTDYRWGINFSSGIQDINPIVNHKTYVRCVREGE